MYKYLYLSKHLPSHGSFLLNKKIFISHMITQYIIYLKIAGEFIQAFNTLKTKNFNFRFINSLYFKLPFRQIYEYITNLKVIKIVLFFIFNYIL